jgi:uncharacterized membrane protein YhaH (DUF805 family)
MNWYLEVLKKYTVFSGRARRTEYWMFYLVNTVAGGIMYIIGSLLFEDKNLLPGLYGLITLIPSIAVSVRRLHDVGKNGAFYFLALIPVIGSVILFIYFITDSQPGDNIFGAYPK